MCIYINVYINIKIIYVYIISLNPCSNPMSYSTIQVSKMRKMNLMSLSEIFQGYTCSKRYIQVSDPEMYCFKIHAYPMNPWYYC